MALMSILFKGNLLVAHAAGQASGPRQRPARTAVDAAEAAIARAARQRATWSRRAGWTEWTGKRPTLRRVRADDRAITQRIRDNRGHAP
jgi:hypothetical protein